MNEMIRELTPEEKIAELESQVEYLDGMVEDYLQLRGRIAMLVTEEGWGDDVVDAWWKEKVKGLLFEKIS